MFEEKNVYVAKEFHMQWIWGISVKRINLNENSKAKATHGSGYEFR